MWPPSSDGDADGEAEGAGDRETSSASSWPDAGSRNRTRFVPAAK
jgi:hypothetical protein